MCPLKIEGQNDVVGGFGKWMGQSKRKAARGRRRQRASAMEKDAVRKRGFKCGGNGVWDGGANLTTGLLGPQASPLEPPTTWGYGLAPSSRENIESFFAAMSRRERQIMSMELLRVLSAVLADIAQAVTNALDQAGEGEHKAEDEEAEDNSLVQTLSVEKANKLQEASKLGDVTDLLGLRFDKLMRSLMATMERMEVAEAHRCSQAMVNKLVAKYGVREPAQMPADAECLLSGFITFGAEFMGDSVP